MKKILLGLVAFSLLFSFSAFAEENGELNGELSDNSNVKIIPIAESAGERGYFNADGSEDEDDEYDDSVDYSVPRYEWNKRYEIDEVYGVHVLNERTDLSTGQVDRWHSDWLNNIVLIIPQNGGEEDEVLVPNSVLEAAGLNKAAAVLWRYDDGQIEMTGVPSGDDTGLYIYPGNTIYFFGDMVTEWVQAEEDAGESEFSLLVSENPNFVETEQAVETPQIPQATTSDNPGTGVNLPVFAVITAGVAAIIFAKRGNKK